MNENFDIMYSPPAPVGRPSKAYLAQKAERQRRRIALLNILRPNDATEAQPIATTNTTSEIQAHFQSPFQLSNRG